MTNVAEARIREAIPSMRHIFIEADSRYDASKDPEHPHQSPAEEERP